MYNIYMDSGTSNTRAYLIKEFQLIDIATVNVGTKDSAISGSNDVLLSAMKGCYDKLLDDNGLQDYDIKGLWSSGMVTNAFGIIEVEHISVPIDGHKLLDRIYIHHEEKFFNRKMKLICGAKTAQSGQLVTVDNIDQMNNVRGEEIEVVGMVATGILPKDKDSVMISPGSHTHFCYVANGAIVDIVSNFTGELNHAIKEATILGGELSTKEIDMDPENVSKGYQYLKQYGVCRALYIIHATRVFDVCSDEVRSQMMAGIISGSVIDLLAMKITETWRNIENIIIIGGKSYVESLFQIQECTMVNGNLT
ncbi:2-keto-3-deoxy-galactonokinase [Anaerovirgula multivorans]|uniref:2-keto-3-deoxy-galactonokinase n=1 Tax=Anaerovirgula multivorans TaxID=312168 RepID=A0A239CC23_9FIRM|nr:2-dehydro-3-deoxygalactonokinase [Anaerovirgula multivorans]SNS17660.1 2-keto-3-deoxy-galactonokinase [Anaerovirgula multivorans]